MVGWALEFMEEMRNVCKT